MANFAFEFWKRVDTLLGERSLVELASGSGIKYQQIRHLRSENRYPKIEEMRLIAGYLSTDIDFLVEGKLNESKSLSDEMIYVRDHPEARALIRAIMDNPALLYPISALVTRKAPEDMKEHA